MTIRRAAGCAAMLAALVTVSGCDRVGSPLEALGAKIPPPDEFQVIASKPLQMPPDANLPEPRPGAASPLEHDPHADARAALLGVTGSSVDPAAAPSSGEQVLLSSANATSASSDIRVQLEAEKRQADANKPYEPPSLIDLLSVSKKEKLDETELLDPQVESERLQQAGTSTPVDPNPVIEEKTDSSPHTEIGEYPPGRPQNPFSKDTTLITN